MLKLSDQLKQFYANLRFVYFGTGDFAVAPLRALFAVGARPLAIVTAPDAKAGREQELTPPPIKAELAHVSPHTPLWQPERLDEAFLGEFRKAQPDIAILADYGYIVPQAVLNVPKYGFINMHPSLLPKYRGATPIEGALLAGEEATGITIMRMDAQLDHGPLLVQRRTKIRQKETAGMLTKRLARMSALALVRTLPRIIEKNMQGKPQDHEQATFTKLMSRQDGKISFAESAAALERKLRALTPWPGIYAIWKRGDEQKRLKILEADAVPYDMPDDENAPTFGTVIAYENGFGIVTAEGLFAPRLVQLEGKSPASPKEFLNGYPDIVGSVLV
ncbi:MAG: methionyl-tRNA formyltransferase [bacterium]|nr:methionyl-tRNA formyltransferase [bacterium]